MLGIGFVFGRRFKETGNPWDLVVMAGAFVAWWITVEAINFAPRIGLLKGTKNK